MEQVFSALEWLFTLQPLIILGDGYISLCASIGGVWDNAANECISKWPFVKE